MIENNDYQAYHKPVLLNELIDYLDLKPNINVIDATFGFGGHSLKIIEKIKPEGKILAFEWDPDVYQLGLRLLKEKQLMEKIKLINENFSKIKSVVAKEKFQKIYGVIFDLGLSSWHYDKSKRGFSFKENEFLDMRLNPEIKLTAFEIVNYFSKRELVEILEKYGEEKEAERIVNAIVEKRKKEKIQTTRELAEIIKSVKKVKKKIHPATQTFLALRNFINQELENLQEGLDGALEVLEKGGRIVIITFHGLEDKVVKNFINKWKKMKKIKILTKSVIRPSLSEIKNNPRSRSAKLRAIQKLQ